MVNFLVILSSYIAISMIKRWRNCLIFQQYMCRFHIHLWTVMLCHLLFTLPALQIYKDFSNLHGINNQRSGNNELCQTSIHALLMYLYRHTFRHVVDSRSLTSCSYKHQSITKPLGHPLVANKTSFTIITTTHTEPGTIYT